MTISKDDVKHYTKNELLTLVGELSEEVVGLIEQIDELKELKEEYGASWDRQKKGWSEEIAALKLDLASQKALAGQKTGEAVTFRNRWKKSEGEVTQYKAAFEAEQDIRKASEIREAKYQQALHNLVDILNDNKIGRRIKGWYWHIEKEQPVYIDGVSMDGMTGYALNLGHDDRFLGSVTDTFNYDHLIRIDRNLENQF